MTKFLFLLLLLTSCSNKTPYSASEINSENWKTYNDTFEVGFIMTFKYPDSLELAGIVDNCRCVGKRLNKSIKTQNDDEDKNKSHWCICIQDTAKSEIENLITGWKSVFKGPIKESRDSIAIQNIKALRVFLVSENKDDPYKELIYLNRNSTLFEFINIDFKTTKDFETFYKNVSFKDWKKPSS